MTKKFDSFSEFYPFYLSEHQNAVCRRLHFVGSLIVLLLLVYVFYSHVWWALVFAPITAYGMAWTGHFFFEKNQPATFRHPLYSFIGDWVMFKDILTGKVSW